MEKIWDLLNFDDRLTKFHSSFYNWLTKFVILFFWVTKLSISAIIWKNSRFFPATIDEMNIFFATVLRNLWFFQWSFDKICDFSHNRLKNFPIFFPWSVNEIRDFFLWPTEKISNFFASFFWQNSGLILWSFDAICYFFLRFSDAIRNFPTIVWRNSQLFLWSVGKNSHFILLNHLT